jgi:hypothetical protein
MKTVKKRHSNHARTLAHDTRPMKAPMLYLTGTSNDYIYCVEKIFREFVATECSVAPPNPSLNLLVRQIDAARFLFPEAREALTFEK